MRHKLCTWCGKAFFPCSQVPQQRYCSAPDCQRERRNKWQRDKLKTDKDYRDNQLRAQQAWCERNPDYSRQYRETHPEYVSGNRLRQQKRNLIATTTKKIAKMDVSNPIGPLLPGIYRVKLIAPGTIAKMDVCTIEVTPYECECAKKKIAKRGRDQ